MDDGDSFFSQHNQIPEDDRWLTALWLLAGVAWLAALLGSVLGAGWIVRQTPGIN